MDNEKLMNVVDDTKELVLRELKSLNAKKDVAPAEWENFEKAISILEKCAKICHMEKENEYLDDEIAYESKSGRMYRSGNSWPTTSTYVRYPPDSTSYRQNDSYSASSGRRYSNGRFAPSRSGHSINDRMVDRLEHMYDEAQTDHERSVIGEWIDRIRMESGVK